MSKTVESKEDILNDLLSARKENERLKVLYETEKANRLSVEKEFALYKERIDLLMDAANFAWWEMNVSTGEVIFSDQKAEMLGYSADKFHHYEDFVAIVHPDDSERMVQEMYRHLEGQTEHYDVFYRIRNSVGEYRNFHDVGKITQTNSEGKPVIVSGIVLDNTEPKRLEEELILSLANLKKAEEIGKFGSWQLNLNDRIMSSSDGARIIYGFKDNENTLEKVQKIPLAQYRPMLDKALDELIHNGTHYDMEFKIQRENDNSIIDIHSIAEYNAETKIIYGTIQDITERKRTEEALHESEEKFRLIIENTSDAILFTEPAGPINFANPAACKIFGLCNEEFQKSGRSGIINTKDPRLPAALEEREKTGIFKGELTFVKKDGTIFPAEMTSNIFIDSKGIKRTGIIIKDITERKQIEDALRESESKYRNLVDSSSVGIFRTKVNGEILFANDSLARMLEYESVGELKKATALVQYKNINQRNALIEQLAKNGSIVDFEVESLTKNGNEKTLLLSSVLNEEIIDGTVTDITNRKLAELKINQQNLELQKMISDKDRFMSILAHDLKSPFNSLLGFSDLLSKNIHIYDIDKIETQINYINKSAHNIFSLLDDLLMWTMSQSGKLSFNPQVFNILALCRDTIESLNSLSTSKNISLTLIDLGEVLVFGDVEMIKTVLRNLITNAIKFSNPKGKISVYYEFNKPFVTVTVDDNGVGIEPDKLSDIFNISRTQSTKGTAGEKGTGLGLILCKDLIEKQGGTIWVESTLGKGSEFKFTLPLG